MQCLGTILLYESDRSRRLAFKKQMIINRLLLMGLIMASAYLSLAQDIKNVPTESTLAQRAIEGEIDELVGQYQALDIFSGVVLVAEKGSPVYHKAFGLADRTKGVANTVTTKFDIGSMNKTFTKMVILQLLEEDRLSLGDHLGEYLSGFPATPARRVTVAHLLNHTSGYGDYFDQDYDSWTIEDKTIGALVEHIKKMPLLFEPGTEMEYSNAGYILLGAIIEKITNRTYQENVSERIIQPLQLGETYVVPRAQVPDRAIGYYKTMKGDLLTNEWYDELPNPDGGFYATALDLSKFYNEYYYGDRLVSMETKLKDERYKMLEKHRQSGGAIPMAGGWQGANTAYYEVLRDQISIVVFANMDEPVAEQLGLGILNIIRGKEAQSPSLPAIQNVYKAYVADGIVYVQNNFEQLTVNFHPTDPKGIVLNHIGYQYLKDEAYTEAIELFQLNTKLFSSDPNVWDSLGEAYQRTGATLKAITCYKKAISLDPDFRPSLKKLNRLKGK